MTVTPEQLAAVKAGQPVEKAAAKNNTKHNHTVNGAPGTAKKTKKAAPRGKKKSTGTTIRIDRARFCQELIANSMNATAAYKAVSPKVTDKTAAANGHKLLRETETIDILTPMVAKLFIDAGIEADYVFKRWVEMSQASPFDYFWIDDEGNMHLRATETLTQAQKLNCRKIKITENITRNKKDDTEYRTVRTELETVDQQKAVDTIGKHLGLLVEKLDEESIDRIGDLIEQGVARIRASKDLDGWKSIVFDPDVEIRG